MPNNAKELVLHRGAELAQPSIDYSRDQVDLIKEVYAKGATDNELRLFLEIAKRRGLDIFSNQIFLVKRYDASLGKEVMRPQTSIDGFRLIADRSGNYAPGRKAEFTHDKSGNVTSATAFVKKRVGGEWFEVSAEVWFDEYAQTKKDGTLTVFWRKMPHVMLSKCAEAVTLRKAFPADLSGLYTSDEMGSIEEPAVAIPAAVIAAPEPAVMAPAPRARRVAAPKEPGVKTPLETLTALMKEIRGYGIADAEMQAHMKNLTGADKRADLTAEQIEICINSFAPWANQLHAALTELGDDYNG